MFFFFFSSRRRHTRSLCDWSSDVCSSDLVSRAVSELLRRLTAVLVLAAVVGLAIRWVAESPSVRHEVIGFIAENTKVLNKPRSEERRVGKEGRYRWSQYH